MEDFRKVVSEIAPAIAVILGWLNYLPTILAVISTILAIVWYSMQIVEHTKKIKANKNE